MKVISTLLDQLLGAAPEGMAIEVRINRLQESEKEKLLEPLSALLHSNNVSERQYAISTLGLLGPTARPVIRDIAQAMNHSCTIKACLEALPKIDANLAGPEVAMAIPLTPQHLRRPIFDWLGNEGLSVVPLLVPLLCTNDGIHVAAVLMKIGPVAIPDILKAVEQIDPRSEDIYIRMQPRYAARALSEFGSASTQPVIDAITASSGTARDAFLEMVSHMTPPGVNVVVSPMMPPQLSEEIAPLLYSIFVDAFKLGPGQHVWHISQAINALGSSALPLYCEAFGSTSRQAWKLLHLNVQKPQAISTLMTGMLHANPAVQANAAAALLKMTSDAEQRMDSLIGDPEPLQLPAVEKLVALLSDGDEQVRLVALEALAVVSEKCNYLPDLKLPAALLTILQELHRAWWQAAPDTGEIGKRTSDAFSELIKSGCLSPYEDGSTDGADGAAEVTFPSTPTFNFIKAVLERELQRSVVVDWGDNKPEETIGEADFSARRSEQPLNAHSFGQPTFFNRHIVIEVSIRGYRFKPSEAETSGRMCGLWQSTPSGFARGSKGLVYAYDGKRMFQLGGEAAKTNVGEVLRAESVKLDQADPVELAWFFCHTLIPGSHTVVESSDKDSAIMESSVTGNKNDGWKLHFWTLHSFGGCMPTTPVLCEHTVDVSAQYDIAYLQHGVDEPRIHSIVQSLSGSLEVIEIDKQKGAVDLPDASLPSVTVRGIKFFPGDTLFFRDNLLEMARIKGPHEIAGNVLLSGSGHIDVSFDAEERIRQISFSQPLQANGIVFKPSYLQFYTTGQIYSGTLEQGADFYGIPVGPGSYIILHPNGRLKYGVVSKPLCLQGFNLVADSRVILFSNGQLDTAALAGEHTIATKFDGDLKCKGWLSLHENGLPHVVDLAADCAAGRANSRLHFDEAEHLTGHPPWQCGQRCRIGSGVVLDLLNRPYCESKTS